MLIEKPGNASLANRGWQLIQWNARSLHGIPSQRCTLILAQPRPSSQQLGSGQIFHGCQEDICLSALYLWQ
jgi:hypothetical protein